MQNCKNPKPPPHQRQAEQVLLRDDHIVLLAVDRLLAAQAAVRRWFTRWRTRQLLAALDREQLRDIGITRTDIASWGGRLGAILASQDMQLRALADLRDDQLHNLSEAGLKLRREARRMHRHG
jgi:uncharacterized protein YjiS (DUF1127 family)